MVAWHWLPACACVDARLHAGITWMLDGLVGVGAMLLGAFVAAVWGVEAERKTLEDVAPPLSAAGD